MEIDRNRLCDHVPQAMSTPSSIAQAAEEKTGPRTPKEKAKEFLSGMTYVIHPKLGRRLPRVWALPTLSYSAFPFAPFPFPTFSPRKRWWAYPRPRPCVYTALVQTRRHVGRSVL